MTDGSPYTRSEEINTDPPSQLARRIMIALAIIIPIALLIGVTLLARRMGW